MPCRLPKKWWKWVWSSRPVAAVQVYSAGRYPWTGAQFRRAREAAGWSQVQLAAQAHLFVYEVQKLEAGQKIPPNKLPRLLACLEPWLEKPKRGTGSATPKPISPPHNPS